MIFIAVRYTLRPEAADNWPALIADFTAATRAEPGNLFFDWSRSVEDPCRYTLLEGFADEAAGAAHVRSPHFERGLSVMAEAITETPEIIHVPLPDRTGWDRMAELTPRA
ncbi:putative quinol monooxygenase [Streptomyces eurythermus]|uniref:putative quinol monooxygenase n=1 Tax=Streptomyces eurythermus TaxID=42237 RepID=UPI0036CE461B